MTNDFPAGLALRSPRVDDHARVLAVLDQWWGGLGGETGSRERALLLPRLYFQHFTGTSRLAERPSGDLAAFLIGFFSQDQPEVAYIHFAGVDPALHGRGIATALYRRFFALARGEGRHRVLAITSPSNSASRAFHTRIGFTELPGAPEAPPSVQPDYDGPGLDRVVFSIDLPADG
ncbi:Acetyltransferase (GNAT) family protein [Actinacidiphila yanglinensis]|uniref:Acetyltransferase (GNAT) family protein n=1 Tax=Actinacidiphila yanglinensis TaxID=310779 RepID=A0A1H6BVH1_9ACTN|nr:GNAT family N-acetyltransferase [Actinacidiphila yanglinensis]SEG64721.1 Acetyltransferase (GNAT) family protein [Actinacidiphila yanglinensis]